jgi:hypothetical protein
MSYNITLPSGFFTDIAITQHIAATPLQEWTSRLRWALADLGVDMEVSVISIAAPTLWMQLGLASVNDDETIPVSNAMTIVLVSGTLGAASLCICAVVYLWATRMCKRSRTLPSPRRTNDYLAKYEIPIGEWEVALENYLEPPKDAAGNEDLVLFFVPREVVFFHAARKRPIPVFQDLLQAQDLKCCRISRYEALQGLLSSVLALSYPWEKEGDPDPDGERLEEAAAVLNDNPHLQLMWMDWACLPQRARERSELQERYFKHVLHSGAINVIYLGCSVVSIVNRAYLERFWTQFEYILATRKVTKNGFQFCADRLFFRCIQSFADAPEQVRSLLKVHWEDKSVAQVVKILAEPDVKVTQQSDKDTLLGKLPELERQLTEAVVVGKASSSSGVLRNAAGEVAGRGNRLANNSLGSVAPEPELLT